MPCRRRDIAAPENKKPYISLIHKVFCFVLPSFSKALGAENETRTRDPNLGKVVLYQLSYFRILVECGCKGKQKIRNSKFLGDKACIFFAAPHKTPHGHAARSITHTLRDTHPTAYTNLWSRNRTGSRKGRAAPLRHLKTRIRVSTGSKLFSSGSAAGNPNGICAMSRHSEGRCQCCWTSLSIRGL